MTYGRRLVEDLLTAVWASEAAYGVRSPTAPDADMPKGSVDKRSADLLFAHLAAVRHVWRTAPLTTGERQALVLRYGADLTDETAGILQGVTDRTVRYRCERGVGKLAAWLNGLEYVDGYDDPGTAITTYRSE
ncbi:hypothetical protein [Streptomyces sp. NPDC088725]|uniref:hypothetical protein n=1 Tax=Streptomyces sp. NPDC088725 TaxID=3365873 RepID=UPI00381B2244